LWDPNGKQISISYINAARFGIALVTAVLAAYNTRLLAQKYYENKAYEGVASSPAPPIGDKKDPCLQGVLAAAAEWKAETDPVRKVGKWIKMEILALICGGGGGG